MTRPGALALAAYLFVGTPAWAQEAPLLPASASVPVASTLLAFRAETTPETLTLNVEVSGPTAPQDVSDDRAFRLRLPGISLGPVFVGDQPLPDSLLRSMSWQDDAGTPVLVVPWRYRLAARVAVDGTGPYVVTITLQKVFNRSFTRQVARGVSYEQMERGTSEGPLSIHVLRVDLHAPGVRVAPTLAEGRDGFGLEPVSHMVRRTGAIAGVNGAYFGKGGQPLGLLMIDGKLVTGPLYGRSALVLTKDHPFIERSALSAVLQLPEGQSVDVDGVNQPRWDDQIVLYTECYGARTRTAPKPGALEAAVGADGVVSQVASGDLPIPPGGFVVSTAGRPTSWLSHLLRPGERVSMHVPLSEYWQGVTEVLGGGPRLLAGGLARITAQAERFPEDIAIGRNPRTAVGITATGELVIVAVDGRDEARSIGLTLPELSDLMRDLGARDAMNLDGGGSTTFVLEGRCLNHPSDGFERPVSNGLLIWGNP